MGFQEKTTSLFVKSQAKRDIAICWNKTFSKFKTAGVKDKEQVVDWLELLFIYSMLPYGSGKKVYLSF